MTAKYLLEFIRESCAIEGVEFNTLPEQRRYDITRAHERFLFNDPLTIDSLIDFVKLCEPEAQPRFTPGLDVRVYGHVPPKGGEDVKLALVSLLTWMNEDMRPTATRQFDAYWRYLWLHPFTDCNGRSARALWAKVGGFPPDGQGFLETFHYQALTWQDAYRAVEDRPAAPVIEAKEEA